MNLAPYPSVPDFLPESAPFTPEQRTWLNGFFAGFISLEGGAITPLSPAESVSLLSLVFSLFPGILPSLGSVPYIP